MTAVLQMHKKPLLMKFNPAFLLQLLCFVMLLPIYSKAGTIYVKPGGTGTGTSWSNAFGDLHAAIAAANSGDQIWIAAGKYKPSTVDRNVRFVLKPGISLYGGFQGTETLLEQRDSTLATNQTIFSGEMQEDGIDSNNSHNLVYVKNITDPVQLNSIILEKAYSTDIHTLALMSAINVEHSTASLNNLEVRANNGYSSSGVLVYESNVQINNSYIHSNITKYGGGGITVDSDNMGLSAPIKLLIRNSLLENNQGGIGGGLYFDPRSGLNDSVVLENVNIIGNTATSVGGGGIYINYGVLIMNKVQIRDNLTSNSSGRAGAIYAVLHKAIIANDVLIADNKINGVGIGGLYLSNGRADFTNCTIANNYAEDTSYKGYNQMFISGATDSVIFKNCIFYSRINMHYDYGAWSTISTGFTPKVSFANCIFPREFPDYWQDDGNNLADTDPLFISDTNYVLTEFSPAIDAGDNSFRNVIYTDDLAGNPRISNSIVDIGAYEFIHEETPSSVGGNVPAGSVLLYPNPADNRLHVTGIEAGTTLTLINTLGQTLSITTAHATAETLDVSNLPFGLNFLLLKQVGGVQTTLKFIKK